MIKADCHKIKLEFSDWFALVFVGIFQSHISEYTWFSKEKERKTTKYFANKVSYLSNFQVNFQTSLNTETGKVLNKNATKLNLFFLSEEDKDN